MIRLISILLLIASNLVPISSYAFGSEGCDSKTVFLGHFDGTPGATTTLDEDCDGTGKHVIAANGNVQINGVGVFSESSLFDGTGDFWSIADGATSPDWDFGTGDYAIDLRVRFAASGAVNYCLIDIGDGGSGNGLLITYSFSNSRFEVYTNTSEQGFAYIAAIDTWYHVLIQRKSAEVTVSVNGVQEGASQTSTTNMVCGDDVTIGRRSDGGGNALNGRIDELRVTKGFGRFQDGSFVVPTTPYCAGCEVSQWFI
jgi:hypothetical protein